MSVKFFGQYLLLEGAVSAEQLRSALELMEREHRMLGELAVEAGILSAEDAGTINREQLNRDLPFGMLAVEKGMLTDKQVEQLLDLQRKKRLRLGEALVQLNFLSDEKVEALLQAFHAEQAPFQDSEVTLPDTLKTNPVATFILDFIPKITMRVSRIHLKIASSDQVPKHQSTASIMLRGAPGLAITLSADDDFANKLMIGMVRIMSGNFEAEPEPDDDREDLLGEFLSIVAGHTLGVMEGEGKKLTVEPPTYGGTDEDGVAFNLVSPHGAASLSLKPLAA
jgi:hypothetical protein